jgi:hypothetical protein
MPKPEWFVTLDGNEWQVMLPDMFKPGKRDHTSQIVCQAVDLNGTFVVLLKDGASISVPSHKVLWMVTFEGHKPMGFAP